MRIAILTFDGFNEIDSFVATTILNRVQQPDWHVALTCPTDTVCSMNGVQIVAQQPLAFAMTAAAVLVGSGRHTQQLVEDHALMDRLQLNPHRQLIGAQCSGALILAKRGLLQTQPACTDHSTQPVLAAAGVRVLEQAFFAEGNIATAGGCLSSVYLATWVIWRLAGKAVAEQTLSSVAPVGEEAQYIERALTVVAPFIDR